MMFALARIRRGVGLARVGIKEDRKAHLIGLAFLLSALGTIRAGFCYRWPSASWHR
jgi:hypothetical protein